MARSRKNVLSLFTKCSGVSETGFFATYRSALHSENRGINDRSKDNTCLQQQLPFWRICNTGNVSRGVGLVFRSLLEERLEGILEGLQYEITATYCNH